MNFMEEVKDAIEDKKSLNRTTPTCESCGSDDIEEGKEVCEDCHKEFLEVPIF